MKLKVEAIRINCGYVNQDDFINDINKELSKMNLDKQLSTKTYQNRLNNPHLWRVDEFKAISNVTGVPIEMIEI